MKHIKLFENYEKWYRGYTTETINKEFVWLTTNENLARQYLAINKMKYGGISKFDEIILDISKLNINDLTMYDMDEEMDQYSVEEFLSDVNIKIIDLEDFFEMDEEIMLARVVNVILPKLLHNYDGIKIMENNNITACIKKEFLSI